MSCTAEIRELCDKLDALEFDRSRLKDSVSAVKFRLITLQKRLSASSPNWIMQSLDEILELLKED